jgi:ElaB/YqjD/DUF883 family membrane-anchored ribosome-binding protein
MENTKNATSGAKGKQDSAKSAANENSMKAHETIDRTSESIQPAVDQSATAAHRAVDRMSEKATQARQMFSERFDQMKGHQEKWADDARVRVRANPMMAVGIAMAAGFLLPRLFSRSR